MAVGPFGPWLTGDRDPDLDGWGDEPVVEGWRVDSALDEFTPIYLAMAADTKSRRGMAPSEVDLLDMAVLAALLGVGSSTDSFHAEAEAMNRRRVEAARRGEEVTWDE